MLIVSIMEGLEDEGVKGECLKNMKGFKKTLYKPMILQIKQNILWGGRMQCYKK